MLAALADPDDDDDDPIPAFTCARCGGTGRQRRTHKPRGSAPCPVCLGYGERFPGAVPGTLALPLEALKNRWPEDPRRRKHLG